MTTLTLWPKCLALLFIALAFTLWPVAVQAALITVNGTTCTLPQAIQAANTDSAVGACAAGSGPDTLLLSASLHAVSYNALFDADGPNATPSITSTIVISGGAGGAVVARTGAADARLFHVAATGNLTLQNVTVQNGRVSSDNGGGIYNAGGLTLANSLIFSNVGNPTGGGLYNGGSANLTGTQLFSNTASYEGGGLYNFGIAILSDTEVNSNTAGYAGGGLINFDTATLTDTHFIRNSTGSNGGGFYNGGTATLATSEFLSNTAGFAGGGFHNSNTGTAIFTSSELRANISSDSGGGLYDVGTATLTDTQLISNTAAFFGGGFYSFGTTILTDTQVVSNTASSFGGGFYGDGDVTLIRTKIISNSTAGDGGGFYNNNNVTLNDTELISNTAVNGGGFYNLAVVTLTNSDLRANAADNGGGFNNAGTIIITGTTFISNTASGRGGGFHNGAAVTIINTQVISNRAGGDGGGFYNLGTVTLTGSELRANQSDDDGGGFYNLGTVTLATSDLLSNTAPDSGGGFANNGTATLNQVRILNNVAGARGGAFNHSNAVTTIDQSCIINNSDLAVNRFAGVTAINAENNWWGAPDGPSGVAAGAGDSVSSDVDFAPFLTSAILGCPMRTAEVSVVKRATPTGTLLPGQPLTYTLTFTNNGSQPVYNVHVTDALPAGFVLSSTSVVSAPYSLIGTTYVFTTLTPLQTVSIYFVGRVDPTLTSNQVMTNTAIVTSPVLALNSSVAGNVVVPTLNWSSTAYTGSEGEPFTATVVLSPTTPYTTVTAQVLITDSAGLLAVAALQNLTFPPGSSSQPVIIPPLDDDSALTRTLQLVLGSPSGATIGSSSSATLVFSENDTAGLIVDKRANSTQALVGEVITYTYRITNTGNVTLTTITASDDKLGAVAGLAGALAPGGTRTAMLTYTALPGDVGTLVNTVTVTGTDGLGGSVVAADTFSVVVGNVSTKVYLPIIEE